MMSPRVAPPMIGLGLLEAVPRSRSSPMPIPTMQIRTASRQAQPGLVAREQQGDARPLRLEGGVPSINQQAAEAANGDIGLSTTMIRRHQATAPEARRIASMRRTAIRRNIRTSSLATICSSSSRSIPTTLPSAAARSRRPQGAEGQGAVLFDRLRQLP
jgi:hypothetical protein